ncbi:hypothetical protein B0H14DRAFT_2643463 [Mycena olivaceomarginata]|nr:hypothetical protein B0H14DRAFT_2643463 [Mycena olivaceomarginata]
MNHVRPSAITQETIRRSYAFIPHSRAQLIVLAGLLRLVSAVSQIVPACAQSGWTAFLPADEPATSPTWDTYPPLSTIWIFPGTEEFPMDQPLRDPFSVADHTTLLRIARPNLRVLVHFMARNHIREVDGPRMAVSLLNEALEPAYPIFANSLFAQELLIDEFRAGRLSPTITHIIFNSVRSLIASLPPEANRTLTPALVIPCLPHEDLSSEPYPVMDMSDYNSMWYWWRRLQDEHPSAVAARGAREESTSLHYRPTTPSSISLAPNPATPLSQTGPSAVGSASFDIRSLRGSAKKDTSSPRNVSAIAVLPSHSAEMQVDLEELAFADTRVSAEAADTPAHRCGPPRSAARGKKTPRRGAPPARPTPVAVHFIYPLSCFPFIPVHELDKQGRPMIIARSSQKSITPPAEETYNEEGEEEKEEEEDDEEPVRPTKRQRTSSRAPKDKGKAKASTPAPPSGSSRFPLVDRKTRGKRKQNELPPYVPPQPVPTMDTVRLAAESLAKEQSEPTVVPFVITAIKGAFPTAVTLSPSLITLVPPITSSPTPGCGNELVTDLSAARADYELAREQLFRTGSRLSVAGHRVGAWIRGRISSLEPTLPKELQPIWAQLLLDSQRDLSVDYRTAVLQYPFISDPRRTESTTDGDLAALINFLEHRDAQAHQPTPPPEESSKWPAEDEAGPSGSK